MGKAAITTWAKRSIDRVMTSEPRPYRAKLDDLFLLSKKQLTYRNRSASRSYDMPTKRQLEYYLSKNYSTIFISKATNKPIKTRNTATPHYYREE